MPGFLLDSNHVRQLFSQHPNVISRAKSIPDAQLRTSAITLGEIDAGHRRDQVSTNPARRDEYMTWINTKFLVHVCAVTEKTRSHYAEIIGRVYDEHPKTSKHQKTERHLVADLGIDINDVWIAALALEHGLILVTNDGMDKIRPTVQKLGLKIEDWMMP